MGPYCSKRLEQVGGGTVPHFCQICGIGPCKRTEDKLNEKPAITVNDALPVVRDFLAITDVSVIFGDDDRLGMAMSDLLEQAIIKLEAHVNEGRKR